MGSPFYSAPDDIEMTELLGEQGQATPTPSLNMDHTPQRAPMLVPIMEEEEWLHADVLEECQIFKIARVIVSSQLSNSCVFDPREITWPLLQYPQAGF